MPPSFSPVGLFETVLARRSDFSTSSSRANYSEQLVLSCFLWMVGLVALCSCRPQAQVKFQFFTRGMVIVRGCEMRIRFRYSRNFQYPFCSSRLLTPSLSLLLSASRFRLHGSANLGLAFTACLLFLRLLQHHWTPDFQPPSFASKFRLEPRKYYTNFQLATTPLDSYLLELARTTSTTHQAQS